MSLNRRAAIFGLGAVCIAGCTASPSQLSAEATLPTAANPGWDAWVAGFRGHALGAGISSGTFDRAFANAGYIPGVIERDRNQSERIRTTEDYLAIVADDEQVNAGRAKMASFGGLLSELQSRYGVERHVIAAIWGVESRYGTRRGTVPVISATSTLAYDGRRRDLFTSQLLAALRIQQNGDVAPSAMVGSWAGAMGHTQFIPTTYLSYAVDYRGDGRRDIWSDDPTDALASAANYVARSGWQTGQPWGVEVRLPAGFDTSITGRSRTRSPDSWAALGVRDMAGRAVPNHGSAAIILPMGAAGPAFMIFRNFTVLSRYNNAVNYIIGVGHLSDRLNGGPRIQASFPRDGQGLNISERMEIQRRLTAAGFDTDGADGVIGDKTTAAIRAYEAANGLPVTGAASRALLDRLR